MSPTCATWRHQLAVAPATVGLPCTSRNGRAPPAASCCISASRFARYCAFAADQGSADAEPSSSLRPIQGVEHAVEAWAWARRLAAAVGIEAGSAGADGLPTIGGRWRTKYTVAAPWLR